MFYSRLAACCEQRGTNVTAVAVDILGVSKSAPTNWKKGINSPNAETVVKAAKYFGVSTDYLLGLVDSPSPANIDLSQTEQELLALFRAAQPDEQSVALNSVRAIFHSYAEQKRMSAKSCHSDSNSDNAADLSF